MDSWLAAVEKDRSARPLADKIAADRPADVTDRCAVDQLGAACSVEQLQVLQTRLSTPRQEAGGPAANDKVACALQPLRREDFSFMLVPFSDAEWADLQSVFPGGVCDWSAPGVGQGPAETWLRYDAPWRRSGVRRPPAGLAAAALGHRGHLPRAGGRCCAADPSGGLDVVRRQLAGLEGAQPLAACGLASSSASFIASMMCLRTIVRGSRSRSSRSA